MRVHGEKPFRGLKIMSCIKAQKYLKKKYCAFLAHAVEKKPEKQTVKDVPVIRDYPEVFPKDLPGLPPVRQVEFRINLIPGANPVVKSPHRLAPSEMQELSSQLQELDKEENLGFNNLYSKYRCLGKYLTGVSFSGVSEDLRAPALK
ncbi:hypothetical protein E3N88_28765 [Mikania micrantha]|uniref:Reverse transcriptase domain-containing protein n=1 Tax=Mikania micrantha TaxID=192012 RepID=A0A5N6N208_9ASTR|nr:hypothetical protein E3N88_28765 [Mikania micrantha]